MSDLVFFWNFFFKPTYRKANRFNLRSKKKQTNVIPIKLSYRYVGGTMLKKT